MSRYPHFLYYWDLLCTGIGNMLLFDYAISSFLEIFTPYMNKSYYE